jgi:hypothetical protein
MKPELIKEGRRVKGFVWDSPAGWKYAFGTPSQPGGYIAFGGNKEPLTKEQAIERIKGF